MNIKYGEDTVESIPQGTASVIRFLWAKELSINAIHSEMHPMHLFINMALLDHEVGSESRKCCREETTWPIVLMTNSTIAAVLILSC